eukprot:TRINITY_DN27798_c0_g2_i2.p1 TRINITY_DN27798_c0_g2~~TRINITY_DN27798_c0_g2_i2.p1  ORF type:complete len:846 (-),score=152.73 TRINITY_DN27798_c0_g2_i2:259-2796(-)
MEAMTALPRDQSHHSAGGLSSPLATCTSWTVQGSPQRGPQPQPRQILSPQSQLSFLVLPEKRQLSQSADGPLGYPAPRSFSLSDPERPAPLSPAPDGVKQHWARFPSLDNALLRQRQHSFEEWKGQFEFIPRADQAPDTARVMVEDHIEGDCKAHEHEHCFHYSPLEPRVKVAPEIDQADILACPGICDAPEKAPFLRVVLLSVLWFVSVGAWILGAFVLPTLEIHNLPNTPYQSEYKRSLILTLVDLYRKRTYFAFACLAFFSVVVPTLKLLSTAWLIARLAVQPVKRVYEAHRWTIKTLAAMASYQLTDLYVGVLFVAYFNSDSSDAAFLVGFYMFFSYCMISMIASVLLDNVFEPLNRVPLGSRSSEADELLPLEADDSRNSSERASGGSAIVASGALSTWFFAASYVVLLIYCFASPAIEVQTIWKGVSIDRNARSLMDIFVVFLPSNAKVCVTVVLVLLNLILPTVYIIAMIAVSLEVAIGDFDEEVVEAFRGVADAVRPWVTLDVFCWASLIFLFTVQDPHTLTMPVEDSWALYMLFGAGLSLFFLRWFANLQYVTSAKSSRMPAPGCWIVLVSWLVLCIVVGHHSKAGTVQAQHYVFQGLDSVCFNAAPLVNRTLREALPAAYGDCDGSSDPAGSSEFVRPPSPCKRGPPLYNVQNGPNYAKALWLGGVNSINLNKCELRKDPPVWTVGTLGEPTTRYHLTIGGHFDMIKLFLHVNQCEGPLGCTRMDSADHCCGNNIEFNISFSMDCRPDSDSKNAFRGVTLEAVDIQPMIIDTTFFDGALEVQALDISPSVEKTVKEKLSGYINSAKLTWAGQEMHIPQLLNHLIAYNSPGSAGLC